MDHITLGFAFMGHMMANQFDVSVESVCSNTGFDLHPLTCTIQYINADQCHACIVSLSLHRYEIVIGSGRTNSLKLSGKLSWIILESKAQGNSIDTFADTAYTVLSMTNMPYGCQVNIKDNAVSYISASLDRIDLTTLQIKLTRRLA